MVPDSAVALLFLGFVGTGLLEFFVLRIAEALRLFAEPNERSSHEIPTPSVGGLAILLPVVLMLGVSIAAFPAVLSLLLATLLLASVGLIDDLFGLPPWLRLPVQTLAASVALFALLPAAPLWLLLPAVLSCLWHVNLFNFMDGIDGIAGVQTLSVALGLLLLNPTMTPWVGYLCCVLVGTALGFLVYNWAPARIFMGDVGSTALGLVLAAMGLHLWWLDELSFTAALILFAGFWFDATYTLVVRAVTGQRIAEAHRLHAYQHLARRFGHGRVSGGLLLLNLLWLLPLAAAADRWPLAGAACLLLAIAPLYWLCKNSGAGRPDSEQ